jgi:FkbM family methyltransferase
MKFKTLLTMDYGWAIRYALKRFLIYLRYKLDFRKFVVVEIGGLKIKLAFFYPNHHYFAVRSNNKKYYEHDLYKLWREELGKIRGDIIDFGGYNGLYGLMAAKMRPEARVYIFEPDLINLEHIKKNIQINNLANVKVIKAVVTNKINSVFFREFKGRETGRISEDSDFQIDGLTLDDWLKKHDINPVLIKMDIEGAEYFALSGMRDYLQKSKEVKILLELHREVIKKFGNTKEDVLKLLTELSFAYKFLNKNDYGCEYYWIFK